MAGKTSKKKDETESVENIVTSEEKKTEEKKEIKKTVKTAACW